MKAVLIGATGATGVELLKSLIADASISEVVALVRRPLNSQHGKVKEVLVDFDNLEHWKHEITGDLAFSCLGTTLKAAGSKAAQYRVDFDYQYDFARLAKDNQIPTFVLVSSASAHPKSMFFYSKIKGELEQAITALTFEHFAIFRPGPLVRENTDRKGEKITIIIANTFNKMGLLKGFTPLHVSDLANLMLKKGKEVKDKKVILESKQILLEVKRLKESK